MTQYGKQEADAGPEIPGYTISRLLGTGSMGQVYLAQQDATGRQVAVKVLLPDHQHQAASAKRMQREALTLAALHHPNIVDCVEHLQHDGRMILVMEYIPGGFSVGDLLLREGRLPERHVWRIAHQVVRGLAHAQALHVIHRDIKPANLLIRHDFGDAIPDIYTLFSDPGTRVLVADFGLTKGADSIAHITQVTVEGTTVGSPAYMSPEQARGLDVDARSDMYALGCTMYQLVTGILPFQAASNALMLQHKVQCEVFPDPADCDVSVSADFKIAMNTLTALRPAERYPSYDALLPVVRRFDVMANGDLDGDESGGWLGTLIRKLLRP